MRRRGPRPLADALDGMTRDAAPATLLARVQGCWVDAVGTAIAAEAQPVSERAGVLVVACRSATWASELGLLGPTIVDKLNQALGSPPEGGLKELRAKVSQPS
jgi:predicted nucleic acid-binding Zn ribbon protein